MKYEVGECLEPEAMVPFHEGDGRELGPGPDTGAERCSSILLALAVGKNALSSRLAALFSFVCGALIVKALTIDRCRVAAASFVLS